MKAEELFFVIDSTNLKSVRPAFYGYSLKADGLQVASGNGALPETDGNGCYVKVEVDEKRIKITQDFSGTFGLFLFEKDGYFALGNSFQRLLDHVKTRCRLSPDWTYIDHFLFVSLCSHSCTRTPVREIRLLDRNSTVEIDLETAALTEKRSPVNEYGLELDSAEALAALDEWHEKWTAIIGGVARMTDDVKISLTGGFDSRATFMLAQNSGADLNRFFIHSINDGNHNHQEDFEIASAIAGRYGITLNNVNKTAPRRNYDIEESFLQSFRLKAAFHKQFYFKQNERLEPMFIIPGMGGEMTRGYWNMKPSTFRSLYREKAAKYAGDPNGRYAEAVRTVLSEGVEYVRKKFGIADWNWNYIPMLVYRESRCRFHYAWTAIDDFMSGSIDVLPFFDPLLAQVKLNTEKCQDIILLRTLMFVRYGAELLDFKFDAGRAIAPETLECARRINAAYPRKGVVPAKGDFKAFFKPRSAGEPRPSIERAAVEKFTLGAVTSERFRAMTVARFGQGVYDEAAAFYASTGHFPQSQFMAILGLHYVFDAIELSEKCASSSAMDMMNALISGARKSC